MSETAAYNEHVNLIRMMSWKFSKRYDMEFDEVFSEAQFAFIKAYRTWDRAAAELTTWLYHTIWMNLMNWRKNTVLKHYRTRTETPVPEGEHTDRNFNLWKDDLSRDAQDVIDMIFDNPKDLEDNGFLKIHLRNEGWKWKDIWDTFKEIREALR